MKYIYIVLVLLAFSVTLVPIVRAEGPVITQTINTNSDSAQEISVVPILPISIEIPTTCQSDSKQIATRGMWVWDATIAIDLASGKVSKADELFVFATEHNINTIYFNSYALLTDGDKTKWDALSNFINTAKEYCISVELLGGEPNWHQRTSILKAMNFATQAVAFTTNLSDDDIKPTAVHLDVEPYVADNGKDWNASLSSRNSEVKNFLNMLATVRMTLADSKLAFSVDMPFWYDTAVGVTNITRLGKTKSLAQHVIDIADTTVVMDYRDSAFGIQLAKGIVNMTKEESSNGMYDLAKTEVVYATKMKKQIVIAAETKCFADPALSILSFCGTRTIGSGNDKTTLTITKGNAYMEGELKKVAEAFAGNNAFSGFAVHYYETYIDLK